MNTKVKITKTQLDILDHRLTIPDCIHEVLNADLDLDLEDLHVEIEPVEESCEKLLKLAQGGVIDWATLTDLDKEVLWDSIDGSTFIGASEGNVSDQQYRGYQRSFNNLVDKLEAVGMPKIHCGFI